jgi:L-fuconolactonase
MIQNIPDPEWIMKPTLDASFAAMIAHDLVFDALVRPAHLNALRARLLRHPTLRAVLDHAGKPNIEDGQFAAWAADLEALARDTSIHCKLSGLLTEAGDGGSLEQLMPYVAHVFKCFGPQRVLWGSDWPVLNGAGSYGQWLDLSRRLIRRFAAGHVDEVMGHTAQRLYRLQLN